MTASTSGLLEREHLLAQLDRLVTSAASGQGCMALIAGEAGAGKTSLVREAGRRSTSRVRVLVGACDPLTTPRPLSPILDIASDPHSGMGDLLELSSDRAEMFTELMRRLKGTIQTTVLIIEDIHWADEGTLDLLRFLGRRIGEWNAVVMCTYRDDEVDSGHPLRVVLGDLATRGAVERLDIEPLSVDAVRTLAGEARVDPDHLHVVTGGNAFYVTEVLAAGSDVPSSVQDAVLARMARLGPVARTVVETVSIAPRDRGSLHVLASRPGHLPRLGLDAQPRRSLQRHQPADDPLQQRLSRSRPGRTVPPGVNSPHEADRALDRRAAHRGDHRSSRAGVQPGDRGADRRGGAGLGG